MLRNGGLAMTDNIVDFATAISLSPKGQRRACLCRQIFVDEQTRTIQCQSCSRVIDPFDYLMKSAKKQQNTVFEIEASRKTLGELQEQIQDLRRERQNLKAQVDRLRKKVR